MPSLAEMLSRLTVKVTSPDNRIGGSLRQGSDFTVRFRPDAFTDYDQYALEHQLSRLLDSLWQAHRTGTRQAVTAAGGEAFDDDHVHWDAQRRRYHDALRELKVLGRSGRNHVRVRTIGMRTFTVAIKPGSLAALDEGQFRDEFTSAVHDMIAQQQWGVIDLKVTHLGLSVPKLFTTIRIADNLHVRK